MRTKLQVLMGAIGLLIMVSTANNDDIGGGYTVGGIAVRLMIGLTFICTALALNTKGDR